MDDIIMLGMETSCDETSCAVVKNGRQVLSNVVSTQIEIHKLYGGVVPEIASRKHMELICGVAGEALTEAGLTFKDMNAVAVTAGPGLVGALIAGVSYAKSVAFTLGVPLIGVNHIEGHIAANYIEYPDLEPPYICLVVSGGHSHIVHVQGYTEFEVLGRTRDDAAGEAFDKIARVLGLGYPGGPIIDAISQEGNPLAYALPRANLSGNTLDFSFSGVKTAVINLLHKMEQKGDEYNKADIAASFQFAVVDVLVAHTIKVARQKGVKTVCLAGGVAANTALRQALREESQKYDIKTLFPPIDLCTDNAAMIACAGYYNLQNGRVSSMELNAYASLKIGEIIT